MVVGIGLGRGGRGSFDFTIVIDVYALVVSVWTSFIFLVGSFC